MKVNVFVKADMCLFHSVPLCFYVVLQWTARECTVYNVCIFKCYGNA